MDENLIVMSRTNLMRMLVKAASEGSDRTAYSGQLTTYDFLKIAQDVLDENNIPRVTDLT